MQKYDGVTLTDRMVARVSEVASDPAVVKARKAITLYKSDDESLALFRAQAANMLGAITVRAACNKPLKVGQARYVNRWLVDANPMFRNFFVALNAALGREFIQGLPNGDCNAN